MTRLRLGFPSLPVVLAADWDQYILKDKLKARMSHLVKDLADTPST
jgi:hypothetical protein